MPLPTDLNLISAATCFAVMGTISVVALLAVEYFAARWSAIAALVAALVLTLTSATAGCLGSWEWAIPLGLLALWTLLSLGVRTKPIRGAIVFVTRPAAVMAVLLVLSLSAAVYVNTLSRMPASEIDLPVMVGSGYHTLDGFVALTDLGQPLPLIAYNDEPLLNESEKQYLAGTKFQHQIIRLHEPTTTCNCHGWVYTGGRFAIQGCFVDGLLSDNGYAEVSEPRAGDVVIYRNAVGGIEHTGLVRMVGQDGLILVESKWGPLGVYLHPIDSQPYGVSRKYYRSPRAGHLVSIVPESSAPQTKLPVLARLPSRSADDIDASFSIDALLSVRRVRTTEAKVYERPVLRIPGWRDG
jgi:hypothetical protein